MNNLQASTESLETAAHCWCDKETEHIEMSVPLATAFAKRLDEKQEKINELIDFAIWMTGCGYEFTKHEYFNEQRDKLLK